MYNNRQFTVFDVTFNEPGGLMEPVLTVFDFYIVLNG